MWQAMGVMLSAAGSLEWFHDRLADGTSFDALVAEAGAWEPGAEGLLFAPYLAGERTPHADPDARGAFVGLQLRHDRGALVRAVLEGVAFGMRDALDAVRSIGVDATAGRASGGGARSQLWLQIVASALDLPVELTESGWPAASSPTRERRSPDAFASAGRSSPTPRGATSTPSSFRAIARCIRRSRRFGPSARPPRAAPSRPAIESGRLCLTIQSYDISIGRYRSATASRRLARDKEVRRCE
jgi:hypothetical protein